MKITKTELMKTIKEEYLEIVNEREKESDSTQAIAGLANDLIKTGEQMEGSPSHDPANRYGRYVKKRGEDLMHIVSQLDDESEERLRSQGAIGEGDLDKFDPDPGDEDYRPPVSPDKQVSRMITKLEDIGSVTKEVARTSEDPETIERLERVEQMIQELWEEMHNLLGSR